MANDIAVFNEQKMKAFAKNDIMLDFALKDLKRRGHKEKFALEVVFNGYVLGDSTMEGIYMKL